MIRFVTRFWNETGTFLERFSGTHLAFKMGFPPPIWTCISVGTK
jgi:hypothetical protein